MILTVMLQRIRDSDPLVKGMADHKSVRQRAYLHRDQAREFTPEAIDIDT